MSAANDYYVKGLEAEAQGNVPSAIDLYLHGLFALKNYWNEVNEFNSETGKIFLDNNRGAMALDHDSQEEYRQRKQDKVRSTPFHPDGVHVASIRLGPLVCLQNQAL